MRWQGPLPYAKCDMTISPDKVAELRVKQLDAPGGYRTARQLRSDAQELLHHPDDGDKRVRNHTAPAACPPFGPHPNHYICAAGRAVPTKRTALPETV